MITDTCLKDVQDCLHYNPETGDIVWLKKLARRCSIGDIAGCKDKYNYVVIRFRNRLYKAHRLAWLLTYGKWPDNNIDHIDGDSSNNRLSNLRDVKQQENNYNLQKPRANNVSGYRGVCWVTREQKWVASIQAYVKTKNLGYYNSAAEASTAYEQAKLMYHPSAPVRIVS